MHFSGRIFDGIEMHESAELEINQTNGEIDYLEDTKNVSDEYKDLTFLPGLIDTHIHFFGTPKSSLMDWVLTSEVLLTIKSVQDAQKLLDAGFTTVRTMGDKVSLDMSKAEKAGMFTSPRIISSGFSLAETGGNDDPKWFDNETSSRISYSYYCDGPWECRKGVRKNLWAGAESIKAYASRSFVGGGPLKNEFTIEELKAISEEAHTANLKAAAHAYGASAIDNVINGGFDSVEHGLGLTEDSAEKMMKKMIYYVPTIAIYKRAKNSGNSYKAEIIKRHVEKELDLAANSGVKIACGTDYLGTDDKPHGQNYLEVVFLSEVLGPLAALRAATSVSAECLGRKDIGHLFAGKKADIIAVRGDPTKDTSLLKPDNIVLVIKNGKIEKNRVNW